MRVKKGDLGLLSSWRPLPLLCTDYKIPSKCLSNRLASCMEDLVCPGQVYCVPGSAIMAHLSVMYNVMALYRLDSLDFGVILIEQERASNVPFQHSGSFWHGVDFPVLDMPIVCQSISDA